MADELHKLEFERDLEQLNGSLDPFFLQHKKEAFDQFETEGIPTRKNEAYKYTDLQKTFRAFDHLGPSRDAGALPDDLSFDLPELAAAAVLTFVNGQYREDLSEISDNAGGLTILPLSEAVKTEPALMEQNFGHIALGEHDALAALNMAFASGGVFIRLKKNRKIAPVILKYYNTSEAGNAMIYSRNLIIAEEGSEGVFIEQNRGRSRHELLFNQVCEVNLGKNAGLSWYKVQDDPVTTLIGQLAVHQAADSRLTVNTCTLEGRLVRNNIRVKQVGENCETHLYGTYLADEQMHVDNQTVVDHTVPHCMSNELYKGILDDKAHGVFNGKVFVRADAQKTNAFQSNKNILLSDTATINTKPQLEIWADDVKCSHGCTTGQLEEEALFYLRARGLDKQSAKALLLYAFALETIEEVPDEKLKGYLAAKMSDKLNYTFA